MTLRGLVASGLIAAATVAPTLADGGNARVGVSAQVARSCRVTTDQPQVSVNCGSRPQPVQVSYADPTPVDGPVTDRTAVAPVAATTVTIHF